MNTSTGVKTISVRYYDTFGNQAGSTVTQVLNPFEVWNFNIPLSPEITRNKLYSAVITSSGPMAGIYRQYSGFMDQTYNNLGGGGAYLSVAPLIMKNYYGWDSSINIQNMEPFSTNASIQYFKSNGQIVYTRNLSIPGFASVSVYTPHEPLPDLYPSLAGVNFDGAARISGNGKMAVAVNQSTTTPGRALSYSAGSSGSKYVVLPDVTNNWGANAWDTSINVHNLDPVSTVIFIEYGDFNFSTTIPGNGYYSFYLPGLLSSPQMQMRAPAIVQSTAGNIAVAVNQSSRYTSYDLARSYTGVNR